MLPNLLLLPLSHIFWICLERSFHFLVRIPVALEPPPHRYQDPASLLWTVSIQSANRKPALLTTAPIPQALCFLTSLKRWSLTVRRRPPPPPTPKSRAPPHGSSAPQLESKECREGRSSQLGCRSNKEGESIGHAMEPRCCHSSRRLPDSHHSSCSMRQQIGK